MKHCPLKNKLCRYVKDKTSYQSLGDRVICNLQAALEVKSIFDINKMRVCPLQNGRKDADNGK